MLGRGLFRIKRSIKNIWTNMVHNSKIEIILLFWNHYNLLTEMTYRISRWAWVCNTQCHYTVIFLRLWYQKMGLSLFLWSVEVNPIIWRVYVGRILAFCEGLYNFFSIMPLIGKVGTFRKGISRKVLRSHEVRSDICIKC